MLEIERKFLVTSNDFEKESFRKTEIAQGYLNSNPQRTVRVRIRAEKAYLTIKGLGNKSGVSRFEWETEIAVDDAKKLLDLCEDFIILKTRFEVKYGNHVVEVDVFDGKNKGLILAEIELNNEDEAFEKPIWLGEEVTGKQEFYNAYLSKNPFRNL